MVKQVRTTSYFEEQVLRKRPYIQREWCERALREPARREVQSDGRIRFWVYVPELGRHLRVVTLEDGETVHNAFPDRSFGEATP
jgi:predicted ATPase